MFKYPNNAKSDGPERLAPRSGRTHFFLALWGIISITFLFIFAVFLYKNLCLYILLAPFLTKMIPDFMRQARVVFLGCMLARLPSHQTGESVLKLL